jgi:hypothetical protein
VPTSVEIVVIPVPAVDFDLYDYNFESDDVVAQMESVLDESVISQPAVVTLLSRDLEAVSPPFGSTDSHVSDGQWSFAELAKRPVVFYRGEIDFNDTNSMLGKPMSMPLDWLNIYGGAAGAKTFTSERSHIGRMFRHFAFHKFDMVFRLHVNTNHFYGGDLGIVFDYGDRHGVLSDDPVTPLTLCEISTMHHALMDVSMSNEVELRVPFASVCDKLCSNGDFYGISHFGTVQLVQTLRLYAPSSVPSSVRFMLSAYAERPMLDVVSSYSNVFSPFVPQGLQTPLKNVSAGNYAFGDLERSTMHLVLSDVINSGTVNSDVTDLLEIARRPSILWRGVWTGNSSHRDELFKTQVHPNLYSRSGTSKFGIFDPTLIRGVTELYTYWQGDLVITVKFGASQFHSGRVVFAFWPCFNAPDFDTYMDVPHVIVDVRERHEFKFVIPFVSSTAWRPTVYKQLDGSLWQVATGVVGMFVLDPLVSPNGSADNIDYSVWLGAGPSFNLAVPRDLDYLDMRVIAQGLDDGEAATARLGLSMVKSIDTFHEDFTCLMKMARRFSMCVARFDRDFMGTVNGVPTTPYKRVIPPNAAAPRPSSTIASLYIPVTPTLNMGHRESILSYLSRFFVFWEGDLDYKVHVQVGGRVESAFVRLCHDPTYFSKFRPSDHGFDCSFEEVDDRCGLAMTVVQALKENIIEVRVPYYSMYNRLYLKGHEREYNLSRELGYPVGCTSNGSLCIDWRAHSQFEISVYIAAGPNFRFRVPNGYVGNSRVLKAFNTVEDAELPFVAQGEYCEWVEPQGILDRVTGLDAGRANKVLQQVEDVMPMVAGSLVNISAVSSKMSELLPTIERMLNGGAVAADFFTSVQSFCSNISTYVLEGVDSVRAHLGRLCAGAPLCGVEPMILVMCLGFAVYISRKDVSSLTLFASVVVALIPLAVTSLGRNFVTYVCTNIDKLLSINDDDVKAQGVGFSYDVTPKLVVHLLLAGIVLVVYKVVPGYSDVHKLIKESGDLGRQFQGIKSGVKLAEEAGESISQMLLSVMASLYGPDDMAINSLNLLLRFDVMKWLKDVNEMALLENRFTEFSSPDRIDHVRLLYDRVDMLRDAMAKGEFHVGLATQITAAIKEVTKLRNEVYQYKGLDVARVDPFHVCFMGEPGVGKSALMTKFVTNMLQFRGEPLTDAVYARSAASTYWDGYRNELVTTFDDLAAVAANVTPTDITEMINLKSNAPTQVVMAALDDKGKHFTSKYIVSTTNIKLLPSDCMLRCHAAFHRRRDCLIDVIRVGPIGSSLEEEESASHLAFRLHDSLTGEAVSGLMSYDEMFELVMRKCEVYMQGQERLLNSYKRDTYGSKLRDRISRNAEESLFTFPVNTDLVLCDSVPGLRSVVAQGEAEDTLVSKAICESMYFTQTGKMEFDDDVALKAYQSLTPESQSVLCERVKSVFACAVESLDVGAVMSGVTCGPTKLLMRQLLKGVSLDERDAFVFADVDCSEAYGSFEPRVKAVFFHLVRMEKLIKIQKEKSRVSLERIDYVRRYVDSCWNALSDDQKSLFRLAMGAGVFVAVLGTIYGVSRKFTKSVNNVIDDSVFDGVVVPLNNVVEVSGGSESPCVGESAEVDCVDGMYVAEEDSPGLNEKLAKRKKKFMGRSKFAWKVTRESLEVEEKTPNVIEESSTLEVGQTKSRTGIAGRNKLVWKEASENKVPNEVEQGISLRPQKFYTAHEAGYSSFNTRGETLKSAVRKEVTDMLEWNANKDVCVKELGTVVSQGSSYGVVELSDFKAQAAKDDEAQTLIVKTLVHNLGILYAKVGDRALKMQCMFVTDSIVIAPWHFFNKLKKDELFYVKVGPVAYEVLYHPNAMYRLGVADCCMYRLGSRVPKVRSVMSRIARRSDHEDFYSTSGTLVNCSFEDGFLQMRLHCVARVGAHVEKVSYEIGEPSRMSLVGYGYFANTQNGECGSPLIVDRPGSVRKIFGMHCAANLNIHKGYSVKLVYEDLVEGVTALCPAYDAEVEGLDLQSEIDACVFDPVVSDRGMRELPNGNISFVGVVPSKMATRVPKKTAIRPSVLNGLVAQSQTEPAVLDPRDPRLDGKVFDPLVSGIQKYGESSVPFRRDDLNRIESYLVDKFASMRSARDVKGRLSDEEVINGIPGLEFYDPMNMKSSEGYPFIKSRTGLNRGKKHLFKEVGVMSNGAPKYDIDSDALRSAYNRRLSEAEAGRRVFSVSQECTKDERVKLKKIYEEPKTRTFSIMPCDYTMATRAYFLDFCVSIMNERARLPPQVGINPMSIEWTSSFMHMKSVSFVGFCADYKTFDGQACAEIFNMLCRVINRWYDDGAANMCVRQVLMNEISKRVTICEDTLLFIENGLPSGVSITVILNSLLNWVYLLLAWLALKPVEYSLSDFDKFVVAKVYGDDNNCAVSEEVIEWYNLRTVGEFLSTHNVVITDDAKNPWDKCAPWVKVDNFSFLKRQYKPHDTMPFFYLAPLDELSIMERILWYRQGGDEVELLYTNILNSLEDAFHHGRNFYNGFKDCVNKSLNMLDMESVAHSYDEAELRWFADLELPFEPEFQQVLEGSS